MPHSQTLRVFLILFVQILIHRRCRSEILQSFNSPSDILTILKDQVHEFGLSHSGDGAQAFSITPGGGVQTSLLASQSNIRWLRRPSVAKDVAGSQDTLVDLFELIENFFKRLETYIDVPPTEVMSDIIVKKMVEVLTILALATKEI
ncbi:hypothetical protein EDB85DRAFT_2139676 [Lactarius pseudohatsudake]|nr:hypothetical protein EDB85DRAFT_2139676 [Lactarius pseudohatsudake]